MPGHNPKHRKGVYRRAWELFADSVEEPNITDIAAKVDVEPARLQQIAERGRWIEHRHELLAYRALESSKLRVEAALRTDAKSVDVLEHSIVDLFTETQNMVSRIQRLDTDGPLIDPGMDLAGRSKAQAEYERRLGRKLELLEQAGRTIKVVVEAGRDIGLLAGPQRKGHDDKPLQLDLSKLTRLQLTIRSVGQGDDAKPVAQLTPGA